MEIEIEVSYFLERQISKRKINLDFLEEYLKNNTFTDSWSISDILTDYMWDSMSWEILTGEERRDIDYIDCIDLCKDYEDELLLKFGHLLTKVEYSCCDNHPSSYTYCPICGKKLK